MRGTTLGCGMAKKKSDLERPEIGDVLEGKYRVEEYVGKGAAGSVYRVKQLGLDIDRALKCLDPEPGAQREMFTRTFTEEVRILSTLTHKNVVKIIDASADGQSVNLIRNGQTKKAHFRYFVMDYVHGGTLDELFKTAITRAQVLDVFVDVLDGLGYLHARDVLHHDVKPDNIVIERDDRRGVLEARLSDLGVAKTLDGLEFGPLMRGEEQDLTYVWGSPTFLPEYMWEVVNEKPIPRAKLREYLPHLDLFCAGATFAAVITSASYKRVATEYEGLLAKPRETIRRQFNSDDWSYLSNFLRRLLVKTPQEGFKTAEDAREALLRIDPRRAISIRVPDLTTIGSEHRIVLSREVVRLTDRAFAIVNHPTFQRLRVLNQLNFVELVYPGARHSRLSHSLNAFVLARRVVEHLLGNSHFRLAVTPADIDAFLVAALCHDIGHFPLAHAVEDLRHFEVLGVRADFQMLGYFLAAHSPQGSLSSLIEREWNVSPALVVALASKSESDVRETLTPVQKLLSSLLDGPIDVDKLAYLVEDSAASGVAYGSGIDVDALIGGLTVVVQDGQLVLALEHKALNAAESLVAARYHMFARVYWHHTNRAIMSMLRFVLEKLLRAVRDVDGRSEPVYSFAQYLEETKGRSDWEAARIICAKFDGLPDAAEVRNPLRGVVDSGRGIYKRLVSFSAHPKNDDIRRCHQFLLAADRDTVSTLMVTCREKLAALLGLNSVPEGYLLVDIPHLRKEEDAIVDIDVVDTRTAVGRAPLQEVSHASKAVFTNFEQLVKKSRIFIHPEYRRMLRDSGVEVRAAKTVEGVVLAAAKRVV
jgi:serine/threonine protein kinase